MDVIETERLILSHLRVEDAEDLYCIYSNPETMKFMGQGSASVKKHAVIFKNTSKNITTITDSSVFTCGFNFLCFFRKFYNRINSEIFTGRFCSMLVRAAIPVKQDIAPALESGNFKISGT